MINARAEGVADKPAFRSTFRARRCIVPASGFYEWQRQGRGPKQPYLIRRRDGEPIGFAGLWESWEDRATGEVVETCTIITCEPNALMAKLHDRMPVILDPAHYDRWLGTGDGVVLARERIKRLQAAAKAAAAGSEPTEVFFTGPTYFARTKNGGRSWEKAKKIYDPGPNEQTLGNQIVVQPDGTLVNFFTHILPTGVTRLELIRSHDKGKIWDKKPTVVTVEVTFQSLTPDQQEPIRDAANLFDVAVDPDNGNLYAVLQEYRYRGVEEVSFLVSTDDGRTWSEPVRINKTPASSNPLRQQAIIPSIAVGPNGVLVVTYYDFRKDNNTGELTDYWAVLCDPGKADPDCP
jgi:hypothetical protein